MDTRYSVVPLEDRIANVKNKAEKGNEFLASKNVKTYNDNIMSIAYKRRDSKLGLPEEVENRIQEYFALCSKLNQIPSIKALSLYIGVPFYVLKKYLNDPTSRYYDMLSWAKDYCHIVMENCALNNKINPATYMFEAANFYDMRDTHSVEIGHTSTEKELAASRDSIKALKELLRNENASVNDGPIKEAKVVEKEVK